MVPVKRNERYRARTHTTVLIMFVSQLNRMFQPLAENMKKNALLPTSILGQKSYQILIAQYFGLCQNKKRQSDKLQQPW